MLCCLPQQVNSLCGEEGQLDKLRSDLRLLNASTHNLEDKLTTIYPSPGQIHIYVCMSVHSLSLAVSAWSVIP